MRSDFSLCLWRPLQSEISFLADTLRMSLQSLQDTRKMVDGVSLACIYIFFLVEFPCARFQGGQPATRKEGYAPEKFSCISLLVRDHQ